MRHMIEAKVISTIPVNLIELQKEQEHTMDSEFLWCETEIAATILTPQRENLSESEAKTEEMESRNGDGESESSQHCLRAYFKLNLN